MDFALTEEQQLVQQSARQFADGKVAPIAAAIDREHRYPTELVKRMAELGLMGMMVPEEWGGSGLDTVSYAIAMENVSWGCASTGVTMSVNNSLYCDPVLKYATDAQKETWLKPWATGEKLGCFGLTEPMSGSDAQNMATRAEKKGDRYILRGQKNFITNGPNADAMRRPRLDGPLRARRASAPSSCEIREGLHRRPAREQARHPRSSTCTTSRSCEVPEGRAPRQRGRRLQDRDGHARRRPHRHRVAGPRHRARRLRGGRDYPRAQGLRQAPSRAPGDPVQARRHGDRDRRGAAADAARGVPQGQGRASLASESAMAKLYASRGRRCACHAGRMQVFGGYGYIKDYPVERHFRDAKITEIYEGTSEIQRIVIAANVIKDGPFGALD
jgi:butyryl-CoA dehydrogenase